MVWRETYAWLRERDGKALRGKKKRIEVVAPRFRSVRAGVPRRDSHQHAALQAWRQAGGVCAALRRSLRLLGSRNIDGQLEAEAGRKHWLRLSRGRWRLEVPRRTLVACVAKYD